MIDAPSTPAAPSLALTLWYAHRPRAWRSQTASVCSPAPPSRLAGQQTRATRPLRSTRVTGLPRYYGAARPCASRRYSVSRSFCCLRFSLLAAAGFPTRPRQYRGRRFARSTQEPEPSSRRLCAGRRLGSKQVSPRLLPEQQSDSGFDVVHTVSTPRQRFTHVRLLDPHLTPSRGAFSATLTTPAI